MRVFLSSTYEDLVEHRLKAANAIERLGHQGVRMEVFGARPVQATEACLQEIDSSDVVVGIYAHRYGYIPEGSQISITEQEFEFARSRNKPIFAFLVDDEFPWSPRFVEHEPGLTKLKAFKQTISSSVVRDTFSTSDDLAYKISTALGRFLISTKIKEELERIPQSASVTTATGRSQVARRAERLHAICEGAHVLLVNDVPKEMRHVIGLLENLRFDVEVVTSTEDAINALETKSGKFDLIISDMRRESTIDAGIQLLNETRRRAIALPTIFTVGAYDPKRGVPPFAFGITNRVDELLNLVFDVLERVRG